MISTQPREFQSARQETRSWMQPEGATLLSHFALSPLILFALGLISPATSQAQTVTFSNAVRELAGGITAPEDIAVDKGGNVYIAAVDLGGVTKIAPDGSQTPVGSGMRSPAGVALDGLGNVYISDSLRGTVVKVTPAGAQSTILTGLRQPQHMSVDGANNLYVADSGNDRILKVTPAGDQSTVGTGLTTPYGVAVDASGNVYIADTGKVRVLKVAPDQTQTVLLDIINYPYDVAIDKAGNLYVALPLLHTILKVAPDGTRSSVIGGLNGPHGVGVDEAGNVFIADTSNSRFLEVGLATVRFGGVNVCPSGQSSPAPCSQTLTLNYSVTTGGTLGIPEVLTQGTPNLDFKLAAGSTCTGVVTGGSSCAVNVMFAPLGFGPRSGAVRLVDASGKTLVTTYVGGVGLGPIVGFSNAAPSAAATEISHANHFAIDAAGNLFVALESSDTVLKISPSGQRTTIGGGLSIPEGVAVDGAGNVFVSDHGSNTLKKIAPDGTQTAIPTDNDVVATRMAVDTAGNLFVADIPHSRIVKFGADGAQTTVADGLAYPSALAIDGLSNLYVAEVNAQRVVKVAPDGSKTTLASGLSVPMGVAVDPAGNVYVADGETNRVFRISPDGSQKTITTDIFGPRGAAIDGLGNLFITDPTNSQIVKLNLSLPPSLTFGNATIGSASADSPQSVTVQNVGNRSLNAVAPGLTIGANFQQSPGSGMPADCASTFALAPAASCNLSISFVPQASGALQGSAVLTDNALNVAGATQTIALSGTGILNTATNVSAAGGQYSDKITLSAQITPAGATFDGSIQFKVDGDNACSAAVTGSGSVSCTYTTTKPAGTYSIVATLTSNSAIVQGSTGSGTLTVTREDATVTPSATNSATVQVNAAGGTAGPITLQATLQQAADGSLGDLAKAGVTVTLAPTVAGAANITCPATNNNGALTATCSNIPVDAYSVRWNVSGNYYQGPQANSVLAIFDPSLGFVTGSGSVRSNGVAADFAISVKYLADGTLSGGITYVEHRMAGDVTVSSMKLSSMSLVGSSAIIQGQASVNGSAGSTFQLYVTDNGSPGVNRDTFGLQVTGGTLNPPISFNPSAITAGNIQTH